MLHMLVKGKEAVPFHFTGGEIVSEKEMDFRPGYLGQQWLRGAGYCARKREEKRKNIF